MTALTLAIHRTASLLEEVFESLIGICGCQVHDGVRGITQNAAVAAGGNSSR